MFVEVVWSGAWLGIEEGSAICSWSEGGRVAAGALWTRGERRREAPRRGGKGSASTQELAHARGRAQEAVGEVDKRTRALWHFGRDVPVLAAAAPASASARERSRVMGRGLWRGAAVGGERWNEHARNREESASQSASRRCQAPCPRAVTKLAWSKRRPGAAKPCLRARPCSV